MNELIIHTHIGLGDQILCNGLIRYLLEKDGYDSIDIFSKKNHFEMIKFMYRDDPRINVININSNDGGSVEYNFVANYRQKNKQKKFLRVGHEHLPPDHVNKTKNCWEYFYEQLNMPHKIKIDYFKLKEDLHEENRVYNKLNPSNEEFIFVHDVSSVGKFSLNIESDLKMIKNDVSENVFHFTKILREAKEIHVIDSSFKCMLDMIPTTGKLHYHEIKKYPLGNTFKDWEIVSY